MPGEPENVAYFMAGWPGHEVKFIVTEIASRMYTVMVGVGGEYISLQYGGIDGPQAVAEMALHLILQVVEEPRHVMADVGVGILSLVELGDILHLIMYAGREKFRIADEQGVKPSDPF